MADQNLTLPQALAELAQLRRERDDAKAAYFQACRRLVQMDNFENEVAEFAAAAGYPTVADDIRAGHWRKEQGK